MGRIATLNRYFRLLAPIFEFFGLFVLIVLYLCFPDRIQITWPLVALIVLLLLAPYLPFISKVRYGDIEAEIDTPSREEELADLGKSPQITDEGEPIEKEENE